MAQHRCGELDGFLGPDIYLGGTSIELPAPNPSAILKTIESQRAMKLLCPPTVWVGTAAAPHLLSQGIKPLRYPRLGFARRWQPAAAVRMAR